MRIQRRISRGGSRLGTRGGAWRPGGLRAEQASRSIVPAAVAKFDRVAEDLRETTAGSRAHICPCPPWESRPIKLGPRTTAWGAAKIQSLLEELETTP